MSAPKPMNRRVLARVRELVLAHLPPLQARIRAAIVADLAERMCATGQVDEALLRDDEPRQLAVLVRIALRVVATLESESRQKHADFEEFGKIYFQLGSDAVRRRLVLEQLERTASSRWKLRADVRALDRWLGYEALQERHGRAQRAIDLALELSLHFIGRGAASAIAGAGTSGRELVVELVADAQLDEFLVGRLELAPRWPTRLAAVEGLIQLYRELVRHALVEVANPASLRTLLARADLRDEHPFVQAAALEAMRLLAPSEALGLLAKRLLSPHDRPPRDFLARRRVVEIVGQDAGTDGLALLQHVVELCDPSDHVRMGVADVLGQLGIAGCVSVLHTLIGLDPTAPENSPKVRARAFVALCAIGCRAAPGQPVAAETTAARELFCHALQAEQDTPVLQVGCAQAALLARSWVDFSGTNEISVGRLAEALEALGSDGNRPFAVHEAASIALHALYEAKSTVSPGAIARLRGILESIRPGERASCALTDASGSLPADPMILGRILAELSRADFGIEARVEGDRLTIWRGDRNRRRVWRIVHELRNRAPNKRQAFLHTTGRTHRGALRAPSGCMDEVTATVLPGERVHVDSEGAWGRHLPLVDDILDTPLLKPRPVHVFSSHGVTTLMPVPKLRTRLLARLRLTFEFAKLAKLRLASLAGREARERQRYLCAVRDRYGVKVTFQAYPGTGRGEGGSSPHLLSLFPAPAAAGQPGGEPNAPAETTTIAGIAALPSFDWTREWFAQHGYYFVSLAQNSQVALTLFVCAILSLFFVSSHVARRSVAAARKAIPFSIGGWGTRGKSGTERLKAALFHGLGFEVFVKTTGCEAMLIHSLPERAPLEIFIFRPYDKATIWEQRDMVELAARLRSEVYLWECMALNPKYVELLQHDWMQDDLVTLTNAYPDHEDIQGPAGINVAEVISCFIPFGKTLFTSETNFFPLFRQRCRERGTELVAIAERDELEIAEDLLALFPYNEHPRNISLVAKLAEHLGVDRWLAITTMAEHVVPDLGVLKMYPEVRVRGRRFRFINGMSANERTGTVNNWRRMGCGALDVDSEPHRMVVTVVNNRADRVSRSEVFSRILVQDVAADRHVLIGTNLRGLMGYVNEALEVELRGIEVASEEDRGRSPEGALDRLSRLMRRLRIPLPTGAALLERLRLYASGAGLVLTADMVPAIEARIAALLESVDGASSLATLRGDAALRAALTEALSSAEPEEVEPPETLEPPTAADVIEHFLHQLGRIVVHARLRKELASALASSASSSALVDFHQVLRSCYRELFLEMIEVIPSSDATGDQIIDRCARGVPPGTQIDLMGLQNIKGTGLDFVYRWIAFQRTHAALELLRTAEREDQRLAALRDIEAAKDFGVLDCGLARTALAEFARTGQTAAERELAARIEKLVAARYAAKLAGLASTGEKTRWSRILAWSEGGVDFLDSVRRYRRSQKVLDDLVAQRISHEQAVLEMRAIYDRQKGGWLEKSLRGERR